MPNSTSSCPNCGQKKTRTARQCCVPSLGPDLDVDPQPANPTPPTPPVDKPARKTRAASTANASTGSKRRNNGRANPTITSLSDTTAVNSAVPSIEESIPLFGVGPSVQRVPAPAPTISSDPSASTAPANEFVILTPTSMLHSKVPKNNAREDIWSCLRLLGTIEEKEAYESGTMPQECPTLLARPKGGWLACLLCERAPTQKENARKSYKIYNNNNSSQTTTIQLHMEKYHRAEWTTACAENGVKQKPERAPRRCLDNVQSEEFSLDGMMHYLLSWIAIDDQPISIVESPEFRRLLLFCARQLGDDDIPRRTKTGMEMTKLFHELMDVWAKEMRNAPGRISFTTDIWTDPNLHSYMAVTAHYIHETPSRVECRTRLIAFRHIPGSHEGSAIGFHFLDILTKLGIEHKVGQITADNASNNNTMLAWIEDALIARSIPFCRVANRLRCFPHILNLAVQALIDALLDTPAGDGIDPSLLKSLQSNPIARLRELVVACRLTSLRREEFRKTIVELNTAGTKVSTLGLIYDVITRWSATYNMIHRFLAIQTVVTAFLAKPRNHDILREKGLNTADLTTLGHIHKVLLVFHQAQELLSSERTPTLSLVLPAYELIFQILCGYVRTRHFPHLNHAIQAAIDKLRGYMELARQNECYGMSMFLNPASKKTWMAKHWGNDEVELVMQKVREAMLLYLKEERRQEQASVRNPFPSSVLANAHDHAAQNLAAGYRGLEDLFASLNLASSGELESSPTVVLQGDEDEAERGKVEAELLRYISDPPFGRAMTEVDLMGWWQVHRHTYPLLWKVARDILPAQASSVPCERVFSSSKQTTSPQRTALSPNMVEKLQILKFGLKQEQLDFTGAWIMKPEEMIGGPDVMDEDS